MSATGNAVWSSRFAFIMASVGFAVGLGNIWRFPYVTGENGGSAFVVIYLLCAVAIGIPCLMAELLVGRRGGGSPPTSMAAVATRIGPERSLESRWRLGRGHCLYHCDYLRCCCGLGALVSGRALSQGLLILMRQSPKPLLRVCWRTTSRW